MFKIIKIIILSFVLIGLSVGFYIWVQKTTLIKQFLSNKLNMEVELEDVNISWGKVSLKQLHLKNPLGASLPDAFQGDISITLDPINLIKNNIKIRQVELDHPIIYLELYNFTGSDNNWSRAINSFPKKNESAVAKNNQDRTFVIEKLTIRNLKFHPIQQSHSKKSIHLPELALLEFENLGNKHPLSITQVTQALFESILLSLTSQQGLNDLLKSVPTLPQELLDGAKSTATFDVNDKIQDGIDFLKRKTLETMDVIENWVGK